MVILYQTRRLILRDNYLSKKMLNNLENKVADLHTLFKSKFDLTETHLRNIILGDNLDEKVLYMNFPYDCYKNITNETVKAIITGDNGTFLNYIQYCHPPISYFTHYIAWSDGNMRFYLYTKGENDLNITFNYIRYKLPSASEGSFGKIIDIDDTDTIYQYIKIKDDEYKLLEYNKKIWVDNEIPYLQYIDNIEEGINNVAEILYKPAGYEYKAWTTTGHYGIASNDYGLAQKPISSNDFERWEKNIELLKNIINGINTIWNVVSSVNWNEENQYEWEEL